MLINGEFKTYGFWLSVTCVIGVIGFFVYSVVFGLDAPIAAQLLTCFTFGFIFFVYGYLLFDANLIQINTDVKTITFRNRFTRKTDTYSFSDLDGKLVWYEPIRFGRVRNVYLIRNKRAVKKLSAFIYSNQKELEEALTSIKDLGVLEYSYLKSWKIFFGYPILD